MNLKRRVDKLEGRGTHNLNHVVQFPAGATDEEIQALRQAYVAQNPEVDPERVFLIQRFRKTTHLAH